VNVDLLQELLDELGSSLESLETQQAALLQFLKDKGIVAETEFAPYLDQAARTSSVRWRAARVRLERLFSAEKEAEERAAEKERSATAGKQSSGQPEKQDQADKEGQQAKSEQSGTTPSPQSEQATPNPETQRENAQSGTEKDKSKS
jgi:uncharacterized protein YdaU (DUF1376 family)